MRREHHAGTAVERTIESIVEIDRVAQATFADLGVVLPYFIVDLRKVDIVDPA